MSIYDVIKDDHRKVDELFEDIRECKDPDDRFALFENLREELTIHAHAEEKVFYSRLEKNGSMRDQMKDSREEHNDVEAMLAKLQDLEPNSRTFMNSLDDLQKMVKHHVDEEENTILPKARDILGDDANDEIAREFQREKGRIQGREFAPV